MNKIRQKLNSMELILRSRKLFMHISRFKYFQYVQLQNNIKNNILDTNISIIEKQMIDSMEICDDAFYIFILDSKSFKLVDLINKIKCNYYIFCTYRSFNFFSNKVNTNFISQINMKQIYDINIGSINQYIYNTLKSKDIYNYKNISIVTIGIDDRANIYRVKTIHNKNIENNMYNVIPAGKYLMYAICDFMSTYYLYEIGKNKQAQEKIECNIKFLKTQLLASDLIIKKNKLENE